tara:strand:- start:1648 stop:2022 length:375 start_codon:yes stop_codon:yes gene_type:complete
MTTQVKYCKIFSNKKVGIFQVIDISSQNITTPPKLIRQQNNSKIVASIFYCLKKKKIVCSGYIHTGIIYLIEYIDKNTVNYYNIKIGSTISEQFMRLTNSIDFLNSILIGNSTINSKVTYKIFY